MITNEIHTVCMSTSVSFSQLSISI